MDYTTTPIRNAKYDKFGGINLELFLVIEGREDRWVPFTASLEDSEAHGKVIYDRALAELEVLAYEPPTVEEVREQTSTLRLLVVERMIADDPENTQRTEELESWALENKIPDSARSIFQALPLQDRAAAMRNENLRRSSPLIPPFAAVYGYTTPEQIDVLFGIEV